MKNKHRVETATIMQLEAVECGAASLAIILDYYNRFVPLERLRIDCGVSRNGTNAANIVKAAAKYGLAGKGMQAEPEQLIGKEFPMIIHWDMNHFVVLEGFSNDARRVFINDPATGPRIIDWEELDNSFTGIALLFSAVPGYELQGKEKKEGYLSLFKQYFNPPKDVFIFLLFTGLLLVIPGMLSPAFKQIFVDQILQNGRKNWIQEFIFFFSVITVMQIILSLWQSYFIYSWERVLSAVNSGKFFWRVMKLPLEFFSQRYAGEIANRIQLTSQMAHLFAGEIVSILLSMFTAVFFLLLLFCYNITLTCIAVVSAAMNILFMLYMAKRNKNISMSMQRDSGKFSAILANSIKVAETIKAEGGENDVFNRVCGQYAHLANTIRKNQLTNVFINMVPTALQALISVLVLVVGAWNVMYDALSIGSFMAFQALMGSFYAPVSQLAGYAAGFQQVTANLNRINDVMKYPQAEETDIAAAKEEYQGNFSFRALSFGYNHLEPPVLKNIDLEIDRGSSVALVGTSGSGKSTLLKLASGLYRPWQGSILFDGKTVDEWNRDQLFARIGTVEQDTCFFSGTIKENIAMFDTTIAFEKIVAAAKAACIHQHIMAMPAGYQSMVLEGGVNLSGGQRQRLEIARALCREIKILLLDEATSALDTITENEIWANIRKLGVTILLVAHRLSTVRVCDEIVVLENGTVVERGSHEELMALNGAYALMNR